METYIALLRGINVGGKNLLPMKGLVLLLEDNGFQNVRTYIQSGNVVFQSGKKPNTEIPTLIKNTFGFKPEVLIFKESEFRIIAETNPYKSMEGKTVHFFFCKTAPKIDLNKIDKLITESEEYSVKGKVFYLHAPNGIGKSKLVKNIDRCLGAPVTGRNLNTVTKILALTQNI